MIVDQLLVATAQASADRAAARSGVVIRPVTTLEECVATEQLYTAIWGPHGGPPANELRAHSSAGSYIVGAYDGDELLGGCLGFWGPPDRGSLHSHIAGVSAAARGRSLGYALKLHQRAYALAHGVELITWTYDPLIARNAHFNLRKLGARAAQYKINYYGVMPDAINAGDETDRIVLAWELAGPLARAACDGTVDASAAGDAVPVDDVLLVEVPKDVEALRRDDPEAGARWRRRLRDRLVPLLEAGGRIVGFDRERCAYQVKETME